MLWVSRDEGKLGRIRRAGQGAGTQHLQSFATGGSWEWEAKTRTSTGLCHSPSRRTEVSATWAFTKTPFPRSARISAHSLTPRQWAIVLCWRWQDRKGRQPQGMTERGAYVALSDDEGSTWRVKTLPGTLPHEAWVLPERKLWAKKFHGRAHWDMPFDSSTERCHSLDHEHEPSGAAFRDERKWILSGDQRETTVTVRGVCSVPGRETYPEKCALKATGRE